MGVCCATSDGGGAVRSYNTLPLLRGALCPELALSIYSRITVDGVVKSSTRTAGLLVPLELAGARACLVADLVSQRAAPVQRAASL